MYRTLWDPWGEEAKKIRQRMRRIALSALMYPSGPQNIA